MVLSPEDFPDSQVRIHLSLPYACILLHLPSVVGLVLKYPVWGGTRFPSPNCVELEGAVEDQRHSLYYRQTAGEIKSVR